MRVAIAPFAVAALLLGPPVRAASFDCAKARSPDERLICATPALDAADARMGAAFKALADGFNGDDFALAGVRGEQRAWVQRRNRACGIGGRADWGSSSPDAAAACFAEAMAQRERLLTALATDRALAPTLRTVATEEGRAGQRLLIRAEHPEIGDRSLPGASAFNDAMSGFVAAEIRSFKADAAELPPGLESELHLSGEVHIAAPRLLSVQFRAEGVQGNGFSYAAALTVDLNTARTLGPRDLFAGDRWLAVARTACRAALAGDRERAAACDEPELAEPRAWRFESDRAVVTLLLPGKELREIPVAYRELAGAFKPGSPLKPPRQ